ncbi:MAG TPA: hypothetical protein VFQ53_33765 [Kofleriaceae bacterium]|nr:hypothetical protein [Kofleriaceae bacterium]
MSGDLRVVGAIAPSTIDKLALAGRLETLEDVLRWGGDVVEVVVQDEYTHDVIVTHATAPAFLVFDTT